MSEHLPSPALCPGLHAWVLNCKPGGDRYASIAVAQKLVGENYAMMQLPGFDDIPNGKNDMFLDEDSLRAINQEAKRRVAEYAQAHAITEWPDIVVNTWKHNAPIARAIKELSGGKSFIVNLSMPHGGIKDFDLVAMPDHFSVTKHLKRHANVITVTGNANQITPEFLLEGYQAGRALLKDLPRPIIAVTVGSDTGSYHYTPEMARVLATRVNAMAAEAGGSVVFTDSHSTSADAWAAFAATIQVPHLGKRFIESQGTPFYKTMMANADIIVAAGDSISMCADAITTGKPVLIAPPEGENIIAQEFRDFNHSLFSKNLAHPFTGHWQDATQRLDTTGDIAKAVAARLRAKQEGRSFV